MYLTAGEDVEGLEGEGHRWERAHSLPAALGHLLERRNLEGRLKLVFLGRHPPVAELLHGIRRQLNLSHCESKKQDGQFFYARKQDVIKLPVCLSVCIGNHRGAPVGRRKAHRHTRLSTRDSSSNHVGGDVTDGGYPDGKIPLNIEGFHSSRGGLDATLALKHFMEPQGCEEAEEEVC